MWRWTVALALAACASPGAEDIGDTAEALSTFPNEQPAFDFFLAKGLSPAQSAGIVGNLDVESGVDPTIEQKGGPGRGIAQWSAGGRWDTTKGDNVKAYATEQGQDPLSLQLQLSFIWFELETFDDYGLAELKGAANTTDAASIFAKKFEGCGSCNTPMRVQYADSVLARFGGDAPDASGAGTTTSCTVSSGITGTCMSTSACASKNMVSTPGFCPGASSIQCCTQAGPGTGASGARADDSSDGCATSPRSSNAAWLLALAVLFVKKRARASSNTR